MDESNVTLPPPPIPPTPTIPKVAPIGSPFGYVALDFDGVQNYVNCGTDIDLANRSFSITFWAARRALKRADIAIGQGQPQTNQGLHIGFRTNDVFTFAFYKNDLDTPQKYTDSDWHFWACVFTKGKTNIQAIYRDGTRVAGRTATGPYQGSGAFSFGGFPRMTTFFGGQIAQLAVWNTALAEQQIKDWQYKNITRNHPNWADLLAYWPCNEGYGTVAFDHAHGHNGALVAAKPDLVPQWVVSSLLVPPVFLLDVDQGMDAHEMMTAVPATPDDEELDEASPAEEADKPPPKRRK